MREENTSRIIPNFTRRAGNQLYQREFPSMNPQMKAKAVFDKSYNQTGGCIEKKRAPTGIYYKEYKRVVSFKREDNGLRKGNELTQQKRDELRAKNQCFTCEQVGHLVKDCPKGSIVRPLGIRSAAIDIEEIQKVSNTASKQAMLELNIIDYAETTADINENENIEPQIRGETVDEILANNIPQYVYDLMCVLSQISYLEM